MPTVSRASRLFALFRSIFGPEREGALCADAPWPVGGLLLHLITAALPAVAVLLSDDALRFAAERIAQGTRPDLDATRAMVGLAIFSSTLRVAGIVAVALIAFAAFASLNKKQPLKCFANAAVMGLGPLMYVSFAREFNVLVAPGAEWMSSLGHLLGANKDALSGRVLYAFDFVLFLTLVVCARVIAGATKSKGIASWVAPLIVLSGQAVLAALAVR